MKRIFDFIIAVFLAVILLVPIFVISLLSRLFSGAPVFFIQDRVGKNGHIFKLFKFRTMVNRQTADSSITVRNDVRVTSFGRFLRKWKLDELPQLWNVLKGDMSFVGPRPDVPGYTDTLEGEDRLILELRPGITGPASLKYRDEEDILANCDDPVRYNDMVIFPDKVRLNLDYMRKCSIWLDIRLMLITAGLMRSKRTDFWFADGNVGNQKIENRKPNFSITSKCESNDG